MSFINMFHDKSKREKLKERYCRLMRKAYEIAPKNKAKSDKLNQEAQKIKKQLQ